MTIEQQLLDLKAKSDKLNNLKIENSTKLSLLENEKESLLKECAELGVQPDKVQEAVEQEEVNIKLEMNNLETEITKIFDELNKI